MFESNFDNVNEDILLVDKTTAESREPKKEKIKPFDLKFYVTDHSPDSEETGNPEELKKLYEDVKKDGITSVRYDWRWNKIEPGKDDFQQESLGRYGKATEVMKDVGLEVPTIVLSSIPEWALKLYKENKQAFFEEYGKYVKQVQEELTAAHEKTGQLVERVQVLNELNNTVYTPIAPEDIPELIRITRETLREYNPDIKLIGTLFAGNLPKVISHFGVKLGTEVAEYMGKNTEMLKQFDVLAVDYYPGMWHIPLVEAQQNGKEIFKQLGLLKETMETIAGWGKEYELGEVGIQTNIPGMSTGHNEDRQRYFYDVFFREFKHMLLDFQERGIELPGHVGLYEAMDEAPKKGNVMGKILRKLTPFPEHDMGMRTSDMERKEIGKGGRHVPEEERSGCPSQLSKIIKYMNAPMGKAN
jgi:hypothetical protein